MDFDRRADTGSGLRTSLGPVSLALGLIAMGMHLFFIPVLNGVFTLLGLAVGLLGIRLARKHGDDYAWAMAGSLLGVGNLVVLMIVGTFQAAMMGMALWLYLELA